MYKLAFKVAALFGLRAGEISGLQVCDIDAVAELLANARRNPAYSDTSFVFWFSKNK